VFTEPAKSKAFAAINNRYFRNLCTIFPQLPPKVKKNMHNNAAPQQFAVDKPLLPLWRQGQMEYESIKPGFSDEEVPQWDAEAEEPTVGWKVTDAEIEKMKMYRCKKSK
jgi:hypothetical protein